MESSPPEEEDLQGWQTSDNQAAKWSTSRQEHSPAAHLAVRHAGADKHDRNRQAQARYRERLREKNTKNEHMASMLTVSMNELQQAQAALQAEQASFFAEKPRWLDSMQAAAQPVQIMAKQPIEEFVVDPFRHSIEVVRHRLADEIMPWLDVNMTLFNHCTKLLGWTDEAIVSDSLCTFMVKWSLAIKAAMQTLLNNYTAQPSAENLRAIIPFTCQLRAAFGLYWHNMLEGHAWPQTIISACWSAISAKWGEPLDDTYIQHCIIAMQLNLHQKQSIVKAFHKWQQQTAAAQHQSAHILPGMQALQNKGRANMEFPERKLNEQTLRTCELAQKQAAAELHNAITSTVTPVQWLIIVANCQVYARDAIKICEATEQSLASDPQQARPDPKLQPAACSLQNAAAPSSRGSDQLPAGVHAAQPVDLDKELPCVGSLQAGLSEFQYRARGPLPHVGPHRGTSYHGGSDAGGSAVHQQRPMHDELAGHGQAQEMPEAPAVSQAFTPQLHAGPSAGAPPAPTVNLASASLHSDLLQAEVPPHGHPSLEAPFAAPLAPPFADSGTRPAGDCREAVNRQQGQQQASHSGAAGHEAHAAGGNESATWGLLGDTDLNDILRDLTMSAPPENAAGPARQNSWELQDLHMGLEQEDSDP
ncbi:hypothetical protein WJX73_004153 [Symbiochloris irregularis]|uniref:BZIP domain-containing protein n=1 Tax=Symbiochloris irregularis TaxID=706552 RepID=A0AAW1PL39_9CHLO